MITGWPLKDRATFDAILGMARETDRAAAILACALLEDHLEEMLRTELRDSSVFKELFGVSRPLGFFSAHNQLAYLMKIYGKPFYEEMRILSQIRNKFAHYYADGQGRFIGSFKAPAIAEMAAKLALIKPLLEKELRRSKRFSGDRRALENKQNEINQILSDAKANYLETCALCASALTGSLDSKIREAIWAESYPPPPNMMRWLQDDGSWVKEEE
jgi:hypothetical protein